MMIIGNKPNSLNNLYCPPAEFALFCKTVLQTVYDGGHTAGHSFRLFCRKTQNGLQSRFTDSCYASVIPAKAGIRVFRRFLLSQE